MTQKINYTISINNQHCIECPNLKTLVRQAENIRIALGYCQWTRILGLSLNNLGMTSVDHVRIDLMTNPNHKAYDCLREALDNESSDLLAWEYSTRQIDKMESRVRESVKIWM